MFKKSVLDNGIRVVTYEMGQMRSVSTTVSIGTGSRYEDKRVNGISHFLEHMLFKGTKKWPTPASIAQAIEGIGGHLNAWTDHDNTAYWNLVPKDFSTRGLEVIADMMGAPLLDPAAIEREKGVIIEEINMQFDDPSSYVVDLLIENLWKDQPLGWPIIGNKENIAAIKQADFREYMEKFYNNEAIVVSVAGAVKHDKVVETARLLFTGKNQAAAQPIPVIEKQATPEIRIYDRKTDQAHLAIGIRGLSYSDDDQYSWSLLNAILGQGMSSRLFMHIREEKGLAYHISSMAESYKETGMILIHAGLNSEKLEEAVKAIMMELNALMTTAVPEAELNRVKTYIKGTLSLSMDSTDAMSGWFGRQELMMPETLTPDEVRQKIEKISKDDIMKVAKRVFQDKNLTMVAIGSGVNEDKYRKLLKVS